MSSEYVVKSNIGDVIYGMESNKLYKVYGYEGMNPIIKNNIGEMIVVHTSKVVAVNETGAVKLSKSSEKKRRLDE